MSFIDKGSKKYASLTRAFDTSDLEHNMQLPQYVDSINGNPKLSFSDGKIKYLTILNLFKTSLCEILPKLIICEQLSPFEKMENS